VAEGRFSEHRTFSATARKIMGKPKKLTASLEKSFIWNKPLSKMS
jgi:hypothetical protein